MFQGIFFVVLLMYSDFVLRSISTEYYVQSTAKILEYSVYFWAAGDLIEELISCFVSLEKKYNLYLYCFLKTYNKSQ